MFINKNKGISLIELLVTLALFSILVIISIPYFSQVFSEIEAKKTTSSIRTLVSYAKHNAYIKRDRLAICGSTDGISCSNVGWSDTLLLFKDNISKNRLRDNNEEILQRLNLNLKHGELSWKGARGQNPVFHPDSGLPRGGNGSFTYCSIKHTKHFNLIMGDMGHVRQKKIDKC